MELTNQDTPQKKKKSSGITRIDGIWVHPRKVRERGKNSITLRFALAGLVPSKKNGQVPAIKTQAAESIAREMLAKGPITSMSQVKMIFEQLSAVIVPNYRYKKWEDRAVEAIWRQRQNWIPHLEKRGLMFPLRDASLSVYFQWKDPKARDNSNKQQSIEDLLIRCGIIANDSYHNLTPTTSDAACYKGQITQHTTIINLTAYY